MLTKYQCFVCLLLWCDPINIYANPSFLETLALIKGQIYFKLDSCNVDPTLSHLSLATNSLATNSLATNSHVM